MSNKAQMFNDARVSVLETLRVLEAQGFPDFMREDLVSRGRYYADLDCDRGECGYPRVWFGKCLAVYKDHVLRKELGL